MPLLPAGIAYDAAGNLYIADTNRNQILESTLAGELKVLAGTGEQGFAGDGGAATAALLNAPQAVAIATDGSVYLADTANQRVRVIDADGMIRTVAGTGISGFSGDGGDATQAKLCNPVALAVMANGALLIADAGNHRVRLLNGAVISTFAGGGGQGFGGDGGPAVNALLDTPAGVAVDVDGRVVIADSHNHRLRTVVTDGTISTLAGTGVAGFAGDGGPATSANLFLPRGVVVLPDGSIAFADADNQRLRAISRTGEMMTLAGDGAQGISTEGSIGTAAVLNGPRSMALSPVRGEPVFADTSNRVVRALLGNGQMFGAASLVPGATSTVDLAVSGNTVRVQVSGRVGNPAGRVELLDGGAAIATGNLSSGAVSLALPALSAGQHSLVAAYGGDGFNPAARSAAVPVVVGGKTTTLTDLSVPAIAYVGLPMTISAKVTAANGTPGGTVVFYDAGINIATAQLAGGIAKGVYLASGAGLHSLVAAYGGDAHFAGSSSNAEVATVAVMPDFSVAVHGADNLTMPVGSVATFAFDVSGVGGAFSGAVAMSVSGLPAGTMATFTPAQVVPGSGLSAVTMNVPTDRLLANMQSPSRWWLAFLAMPCMLLRRRRWTAGVITVAVVCIGGCGTRTAQEAMDPSRTLTLTVTGTGTNLAGATMTHSATVRLTVQ